MSWQVTIKPKVSKNILNRQKVSMKVESAVIALLAQLEAFGPSVNWPHYGKLQNQGKGVDRRHCHLNRGRPTWVACWEVDSKNKMIEVYYVGTHEKAPY